MGIGKWIVGALGWAMFGPIGGILGYFFTSRLERLAEAAAVYDEDQTWNQGQRNSFLMSLLVLSASVIKADGRTTSQELSTLRSFFTRNFGTQAGNEAEEIIRELLNKEYNLYEVCSQIRSCMDYSQRLQLYHYLVALGASDGLHQKEVDLLETIATYIGLSKSEADSIFAQFRSSNDSNYRILEITPDATERWPSSIIRTRSPLWAKMYRRQQRRSSRPCRKHTKRSARNAESEMHFPILFCSAGHHDNLITEHRFHNSHLIKYDCKYRNIL